jgi:hypothetical protein
LPLLTEASDQFADRAWGEAECRGDGGSILAVAKTPPDGLAYGYRDGARHGKSSDWDEARRAVP